MERKRKLPARAAARVEQAAKRRQVTPREPSEKPESPKPVREPTPPPPPPPPLPTYITAGKPLPTIEDAQPDDLSAKEYQSISESGVLSESLSRSRQKWVSEGLFEKYWTKPHKRKGVLIEDPKNPPKDSMTKVGTVTITIEPHIIEATMYAVKAPKVVPPPAPPQPQPAQQAQQPPAQTQQQQAAQQPNAKPQVTPQQPSQVQQPAAPPPARPIIQYGPPNGSMPPPPTPVSAPATPAPAVATAIPPVSGSPAPSPVATTATPVTQVLSRPSPGPSPTTQYVSPVPAGHLSKPGTPSFAPHKAAPPLTPSYPPRPIAGPASTLPAASPLNRPLGNPPPGQSLAPSSAARPPAVAPGPSTAMRPPGSAPGTPAPAAAKPAANDPVIALLAQKASGDPELRDLMKRVAVGQAKDGELAHFQKIIDQLNAEYKRGGGQQGPSADRLLVDGRTVKYFADEVRTILDIVLASNPQQKSTELRPPPRSDPLVVLLVKTALEDQRTKDMIKRIAEGRPGFTDATDLKEILDRLHRDAKTVPQNPAIVAQVKPALNGISNGIKPPTNHAMPHPNPQALRSKGPPPAPKPDIASVIFDFGNGDRYLFPKFSILEYLPTPSGQQVVASFLIVRKGSISEYGGDPKLDYYQPVTIRLYTHAGRHLENLARVVAPQDEVRRYMDDVMDNMTRAEYVLLAMRLPRIERDVEKEGQSDEPKTNGSTPGPEIELEPAAPAKPGVLWTAGGINASKTGAIHAFEPRDAEHESQVKYQRLIRNVAAKDTEAV